MNRYQRQLLLPEIGPEGQAKLSAACVTLVGCGALGCGVAELLVRGGVGKVRIIDRDVVELTNLQRQILFDQADANAQLPKAIAAANRLGSINSDVFVEPFVRDLHSGNAEELIIGDVIIDGTDNVETRYLLNDLAVKRGTPWVYGACVGMEGRVLAIRPGVGPCLRCLFPTPPAPGSLPTCDTAGIFGPVATMVSAWQATMAMQLILGTDPPMGMLSMNGWSGRVHRLATEVPDPACRTCGEKHFEFLARRSRPPVALCGRDAVQVQPGFSAASFPFDAMAMKLQSAGVVEKTPYLLRCQLAETGQKLTLFIDGRLIVHGTTDLERARSVYARYIGV